MSEKIYFVQVDSTDKQDFEQIVNSLGGFLDSDSTKVIAFPKEIKPLNEDEAKQYLKEMADTLDMEVSSS